MRFVIALFVATLAAVPLIAGAYAGIRGTQAVHRLLTLSR